jgi:hypothetical protein
MARSTDWMIETTSLVRRRLQLAGDHEQTFVSLALYCERLDLPLNIVEDGKRLCTMCMQFQG